MHNRKQYLYPQSINYIHLGLPKGLKTVCAGQGSGIVANRYPIGCTAFQYEEFLSVAGHDQETKIKLIKDMEVFDHTFSAEVQAMSQMLLLREYYLEKYQYYDVVCYCNYTASITTFPVQTGDKLIVTRKVQQNGYNLENQMSLLVGNMWAEWFKTRIILYINPYTQITQIDNPTANNRVYLKFKLLKQYVHENFKLDGYSMK